MRGSIIKIAKGISEIEALAAVAETVANGEKIHLFRKLLVTVTVKNGYRVYFVKKKGGK